MLGRLLASYGLESNPAGWSCSSTGAEADPLERRSWCGPGSLLEQVRRFALARAASAPPSRRERRTESLRWLIPILAQDYLLVMRGAERTFATIADIWPRAPIATLLYDEDATHRRFAGRRLRTSALAAVRLRQRTFRAALPLPERRAASRPLRPRLRRLEQQRLRPRHTPPNGALMSATATHRSATPGTSRRVALREVPQPLRPAAQPAPAPPPRLRPAGRGRVDQYIANGRLTRERIRRYWGRDAPIVHPPVEVDRSSSASPPTMSCSWASSCATSGRSWRSRLPGGRSAESRSWGPGPSSTAPRALRGRAEFLGRVDDHDLPDLYACCAALVVPGWRSSVSPRSRPRLPAGR